jgi:hypothetical protein
VWGHAVILEWKTSKALFEKYGGRVGFGNIGGGSKPIEARKAFLQDRHKAGEFVIHDKPLEDEFWRQSDGEFWADVILSGELLKERFQRPPWEMRGLPAGRMPGDKTVK